MPGKATQLSLGSIGQVAINVHDLARAVRFYRDTLGMRLLFEVPGMAFFDCDGVRLMLGLPSAPEFDHPASIIYYRVRNIHVARDALVARGVRFASEPHRAARLPDHDLWLGFLPDSKATCWLS